MKSQRFIKPPSNEKHMTISACFLCFPCAHSGSRLTDGWLAILCPFQHLFSLSTGRWKNDDERLCAMEPLLRLKRLSLPGIDLGIARSAGQRLNHWVTQDPPILKPNSTCTDRTTHAQTWTSYVPLHFLTMGQPSETMAMPCHSFSYTPLIYV